MRAFLLLLLLLQDDPHRAAVDAGVTFPAKADIDKASAKSAWHKEVVKELLDPALWAKSLKALEERTGVKAGKLEIRVFFGEIPNAPACGTGSGGNGSVQLDLDKLAKYAKGADEVYRRKKAGAIVVVPPARTDLTIPHELVHCFQGVAQPEWFLEGMADYVGRDPNHVMAYRAAGQKPKAIDAEIAHDWIYARGWAFFEWMEAKHGADGVKKFIALALEGRPAPEAAVAVAGGDWAAVVKAEAAWSADWVKRFGS